MKKVVFQSSIFGYNSLQNFSVKGWSFVKGMFAFNNKQYKNREMTKQLRFIGALAVAGTMMMTSCKKDVSPAEDITFEEVLKSGGEFDTFENHKILSNSSTSSIPVDSGNYTCTSNTWNVLQGHDDFPVYDPNVNVVYPGSLLQGASLTNATPDVVAVKRGPGTVSIDLVNGSNSVYVNLPEVKKSYVTQALNDIVYDNNEVLPSRFTFTHEQIKSQEELALALNVNVDIAPVTVGTEFEFSNESNMNHYLVTLKQTFFTMSYDIPSSYDEFFDPSVTPMDLAKYVNAGNPACYVSDVTYGRVFHLLIESSSSIMKIKGAVNLSFSNAPVSGEIEANYLSSLDSLSVKVLAIGGTITPTFSAISATNLSSLTTQLGKSTDIKAGVPLSYVVRTVYNNKLVKNKINLEYSLTDCVFIP